MSMIPKNLGTALITAGLMSVAQAAPVALSAVIDFDGLTHATGGNPGDVVTTQYLGFGLEFTGHNEVRCSQRTNSNCTATRALLPPPHAASSPNFLMNSPGGTGFSIRVLSGFALTSLTLDLAANPSSFFINFLDDRDNRIRQFARQFGTDFLWETELLSGVNSAVRRIEFGGDLSSSFAIDHLRFDYVVDRANVPEPAVLGLVALALAGVALSRRRKG